MEIKKILIITIISILFFSYQQNINLEVESKDEIVKFMQACRDVWRAGDSTTILNKISADIVLFQPGKTSKPITGKNDVSGFWFPDSDISYPIIKYEIEHEEIGRSNDSAYY